MSDVYCFSEDVPYTEDGIFQGSCIGYATLHVVENSIELYKASNPWKDFKEIVKIMPEHNLIYMVDDKVYKTYSIEEGTTIIDEPSPIKEGYTFSGWSEIPKTMPAHDVTVTGSFTVNQYTITYIIDNEVYTTQTVNYGSTIVPPAAPERKGYDFAWGDYPETMPAYDITIYGTYTTGVESIITNPQKARVYTIDGKAQSEPQKGINIINGKKYVKK